MAAKGAGFEGKKLQRPAGRPRILSKELILEAALEIPLDELSFLRLGEKMGVASQSFYRYFANIGELRRALATKVVHEVEFLDDQPLGDFEAYVVRFLIDYRDWLVENNLSPDLFQITYGATKFAHGDGPSQLYTRLEDFLETAALEGIPQDEALLVWFAITDFMSRSISISLPEDFSKSFHDELAAGLEDHGRERFPRIAAYLEQTGNRSIASGAYFDETARALVRGLMRGMELRRDPADRG